MVPGRQLDDGGAVEEPVQSASGTSDPGTALVGVLAGVAVLGCAAAAVIWSFAIGQRVPLLSGVDLGFHELGHMIAMPLPPMTAALAGTALQVGVPLGLAVYFGLGRRESNAAALMLVWAGTALRDASVYIGDAPYEALPLLGAGQHDWAYILGAEGFRALGASSAIAGSVWTVGLLCVLGGAALAAVRMSAPELARRRARIEAERLAILPRREPVNPNATKRL
jgi:hypothetical protein